MKIHVYLVPKQLAVIQLPTLPHMFGVPMLGILTGGEGQSL